jgi:hypothetical protein
VRLEIIYAEDPSFGSLPDVTHDAAAIARTVRM